MTPPSLFPRRRERPCACLADPSEMQLPSLTGLYKVWNVWPEQYRRGRKYWELDYLVGCAESLNLLRPDITALGLGVGREVLMFYFARYCKGIIATDLYSSDTEWREANADALEEIYQAAPFSYPRDRLQIEISDMRNTKFSPDSFDFVWSCGSIEHVPTLFDVYNTFVEIYRVLKPGGYALITTEYCLFAPPYLYENMNALDETLVNVFLGQLGGLQLVGPLDLSYNCAHPLCAVAPRQYMFAEHASPTQQYFRPLDYVHLTGLSAIIPIGFVLKKIEQPMVSWQDLPLPDNYRTYDDARNLHLQQEPAKTIQRLVDLVSSPAGEINRQLHLNAIAILLQYASFASNPNSSGNVSYLLELFLSLMPDGELQDPNLLHYIAALFVSKGNKQQAAALFYKAALSPSAFADHAIVLAIEHLKLKLEMDEIALDREPLCLLVEDLIKHGYSITWVKNAINNICKTEKIEEIFENILSKAKASILDGLERQLV